MNDFGVKIKDVKVKMFVQNINGLMSKRAKLLSSGILDNFNLFLLQETNLASHHVNIDNFKWFGFSTMKLSTTESGEFCRGMFLGYRNSISHPVIVDTKIPDKFEIRCIKINFAFESINVICAYRSPSMNNNEKGRIFYAFTESDCWTQW